MEHYDEIMKRGYIIYENEARLKGETYCNRKFADISDTLAPEYILVEERFTTGHDDSAEFVELIDKNENIIKSWMFDGPLVKRFQNPDIYDDDCLVYYLKETFKLRVLWDTWGRKAGEL